MKPERKVYYNKNGQVERESWYLNGRLHREDGPAIIWYHKNGQIEHEHWYFNSQSHRENGPAIIYYYKSGKIKTTEWYINGKKLTKEEAKIQKELLEFDRLLEEAISEA